MAQEDLDFANKSKARFRNLLQDRWRCVVPGHSFCYEDCRGVHQQLSSEALECWASALHDGEASLLTPPDSIVLAGVVTSCIGDGSDNTVVDSDISSRDLQEHHQYHRQYHPSLVDLPITPRSCLSQAPESRSSTALTSSTTSSGAPGVGYLAGKAVKWIGNRILDTLVPLVVRRRRRLTKRFITNFERIPLDKRAAWLVKKREKLVQIIEFLLELSGDEYKLNYRTSAIEQGALMKELIEGSMFELDTQAEVDLNLMEVRIFPLYLLANPDIPWGSDLASDIREILLQGTLDSGPTGAQVATRICIELLHGSKLSWRHRDEGYATLLCLYLTPQGRRNLQNLDQNSEMLRNLATSAFSNGITDIIEQARAVHLFAYYSNEAPRYRRHIMDPKGLPLLIRNFQTILLEMRVFMDAIDAIWVLCEVMADISSFPWTLPAFIGMYVCPSLAKALLLIQVVNDYMDVPCFAWVSYCLIRTMRNIVVLGGMAGHHAVEETTSDYLREELIRIANSVQDYLGGAAGLRMHKYIQETWPGTKPGSAMGKSTTPEVVQI